MCLSVLSMRFIASLAGAATICIRAGMKLDV